MSGRRCKAIRREFRLRHSWREKKTGRIVLGDPPEKADLESGALSQWRRLKKQYKRGTR